MSVAGSELEVPLGRDPLFIFSSEPILISANAVRKINAPLSGKTFLVCFCGIFAGINKVCNDSDYVIQVSVKDISACQGTLKLYDGVLQPLEC